LFTSPLFRRLFLPYFLVICCCIAVVGLLGAQRLRATYLLSVEQKLRDNSLLISRLLQDTHQPWQLRAQITELGQTLGCRITVIQTDGVVIADNEADPAHMENHRLRPEIVSAISTGEGISVRKSDTVHEELVYFARRMNPDPTSPVLRLAVHIRELDRQLAVLYRGLGITAVLAIVAGGAICFYIARRQTMPLVELTQFADALSRGNLSHRITQRAAGEVATLSVALNSMADSLAKLLSDSATDRTRLRAVLSAMSEGVIATDGQQRILLANSAAGRLLGFDADHAIGRPLWEIVRTEQILKASDPALRENRAQRLKIGPISGRFFEVVLSPFSAADGQRGLVIAAHDTTETVRYEELRKEFVANVSHELRTPITAIKGFAETLRAGAMNNPEKAGQFLGTIEKHADQLTNLVTDLLDLASLEAQVEPFIHGPVDLDKAARRAVELLAPAAHRKAQTIDLQLDPNLPTVQGNADYLERAIANLLDNAIKYTPEGGAISVRTRLVADSAIVEVTDNGIGIPAEDLPRIFERFYRVDRSRSRAMGGTGLGLSIVKHVAQSHGGTVEVTTSVGKGSTFALKLPV